MILIGTLHSQQETTLQRRGTRPEAPRSRCVSAVLHGKPSSPIQQCIAKSPTAAIEPLKRKPLDPLA
jgi:hypothetical protein